MLCSATGRIGIVVAQPPFACCVEWPARLGSPLAHWARCVAGGGGASESELEAEAEAEAEGGEPSSRSQMAWCCSGSHTVSRPGSRAHEAGAGATSSGGAARSNLSGPQGT
jgi:hypothetical protein